MDGVRVEVCNRDVCILYDINYENQEVYVYVDFLIKTKLFKTYFSKICYTTNLLFLLRICIFALELTEFST